MKNRVAKKIVSILTATTMLLFALPVFAATNTQLAQSEGLETLRKEVIDTTAALEVASTTEQSEIKTRQEALAKIFTFSSEETKEILEKDRLHELAKEKTETGFIAKELITSLEDHELYIEERLTALENPEMTLDEVKAMAGDFKAWREKNYDPVVKSTLDLLLVDKGMRALETTKARFEKIRSDVLKLEALKQAEQGLFAESIMAIEKELATVAQLQTVAENTLEKSPVVIALHTPEVTTGVVVANETEKPSEEESITMTMTMAVAPSPLLSEEATTTPEVSLPEEETLPEIQEVVGEAVGLIKDSIYQEFFKMSKLAQSLLSK